MHAGELDHRDLLALDSEDGVVRFAGQRSRLLDAVAMSLPCKSLVDNFGINAARAVLTRFGLAHGWRMVGAMEFDFQ